LGLNNPFRFSPNCSRINRTQSALCRIDMSFIKNRLPLVNGVFVILAAEQGGGE